MTAKVSQTLEIPSDKWPKTVKQLQKLIDLINWFRNFVPKISEDLMPITNKLKHQTDEIKWCDEDKAIIRNIFDKINQQTRIYHLNPSKKIIIETDASDRGVSAILRQKGKVIGLYSNKLILAK